MKISHSSIFDYEIAVKYNNEAETADLGNTQNSNTRI